MVDLGEGGKNWLNFIKISHVLQLHFNSVQKYRLLLAVAIGKKKAYFNSVHKSSSGAFLLKRRIGHPTADRRSSLQQGSEVLYCDEWKHFQLTQTLLLSEVCKAALNWFAYGRLSIYKMLHRFAALSPFRCYFQLDFSIINLLL